jgi:hypothetical protein
MQCLLHPFLYAQRFVVPVLIFYEFFSSSERAQPPRNNFLEVIERSLSACFCIAQRLIIEKDPKVKKLPLVNCVVHAIS